jgi:hypothetical protein
MLFCTRITSTGGDGEQARVDRRLDLPDQALDGLGGINHSDENRLFRARQMMTVQRGGFAVAFQAAEDGGSSDLQLAAAGDDGLVQWPAMPPVAGGDVDAQELSGLRFPHGIPPARRRRGAAGPFRRRR